MKNIIILIAIYSSLFLTSCKKEEVALPDTVANLYFQDALYPLTGGGYNAVVDTTGFTFAFSTAATVDSFFKIQVNLQGAPTPVDREYKVTIDPASTAVEGQHYTLPEHFIFRANHTIDTLSIMMYRKPEMKLAPVALIVHLEANENFTVDMVNRDKPNGSTISWITRKIVISDILTRPARWQNYLYGIFSAKKLYLMNEVMGTPLYAFNSYIREFDLLSYYWSVYFHRWLQEQKAAGNTIYEEDGVTEMRMGNYPNN